MPHILTHLYYASKISKDPGFLYGSVFPDNFCFIKKRHNSALEFARKLAKKNPKYKMFCKGVKMHIQFDNKFHKKILPSKLKKLKSKFNISTNFAHSIIEIALDSNIHKNKSREIDELLESFKRFNNRELIYYLSRFAKRSEGFLSKVADTIMDLIKISNKFTLYSLLTRAKIIRQYFKAEFEKNKSYFKDIFKFVKVFKYSKELTKDYENYL